MKKTLPAECIDCVVEKKLYDYPENANPDKIAEYKRGVLKILLNSDQNGAAPLIGRNIANLKEKLFGTKTDYSDIKKQFNLSMLKLESDIYSSITSSVDPFIAALKYAVAGNYIDVSTVKDVNENSLSDILKKSAEFELSAVEIENLRSDVASARKIAYITDNCGEIVLDKLLIKIIKTLNPKASITAIVRGKPVANDAVLSDAELTGLTEICHVLDNGTNIPGTYLKEMSIKSKRVLKNADVIISKGQGNYETLYSSEMNVYYLFLCKCDMFLKKFNVPLFYPVLINEKRQ